VLYSIPIDWPKKTFATPTVKPTSRPNFNWNVLVSSIPTLQFQKKKFHLWITLWTPQDMSPCTSEEQVTLHIDNCMWCPLFHKWKLKWKFSEVPRGFTCSFMFIYRSLSPAGDKNRVKSLVKCRIFPMSIYLWKYRIYNTYIFIYY